VEVKVGQTAAEPPSAIPRRARGDRTKSALVDAAVTLSTEKGVEATSVDEITTAAAVAKGTFYVHFQHKEDVLLERAARLVVALTGDPALHEDADAPTTLRRIAEALAALHRDGSRPLTGRSIRELVGDRERWRRVLGDRPTLQGVLHPVISRGRSEGSIRDDLSTARLTQGLTILWLDTIIGWSEREEERELVEELLQALRLFLDGARAR
jgi:AcrR family transcriptional regulator